MKAVLWVVEVRGGADMEWMSSGWAATTRDGARRFQQNEVRGVWRFTRIVRYVREGCR